MSKPDQQKMYEVISHWQQSGLSQKTWCEQNNIAYSSFHYWYRRYRVMQAGSTQDTKEGFVEILVQDRVSNAPWCELVFGNGKKLLFHQAVSAEFIRTLVD